MGFFNFLKKKNLSEKTNSDNGVLGPTFLEGVTENIIVTEKIYSHEWRRKLKTNSGNKFKIKFYGQFHKNYKNIIIATDFAPSLVFAEDVITGEEILLFDGCKYGYNAMFCDKFSEEQITNRPVTNYFIDSKGNDVFEIIISTYNGIDYDDEFMDEVDSNGFIEIIDGTKVEFEKVKRNGYDTIRIWGLNSDGDTIEVLSEELS